MYSFIVIVSIGELVSLHSSLLYIHRECRDFIWQGARLHVMHTRNTCSGQWQGLILVLVQIKMATSSPPLLPPRSMDLPLSLVDPRGLTRHEEAKSFSRDLNDDEYASHVHEVPSAGLRPNRGTYCTALFSKAPKQLMYAY